MNGRWFLLVAAGGALGCTLRFGVAEILGENGRVAADAAAAAGNAAGDWCAPGLLFALVAAGGALGCVMRGAAGVLQARTRARFPWATLLVNAAGSALFGFAAARLPALPADAAAFWGTLLLAGFCGGLTTFSSFAWQTVDLAQNGRRRAAALSAAANVILCLAFCLLAAHLAAPSVVEGNGGGGAANPMANSAFPWGTLLVNVSGSFFVGLLAARQPRRAARAAERCNALLIVGFCGGLTTFSGFSAQTLGLFLSAQPAAALSNLAANLALCLVAAAFAYRLARTA